MKTGFIFDVFLSRSLPPGPAEIARLNNPAHRNLSELKIRKRLVDEELRSLRRVPCPCWISLFQRWGQDELLEFLFLSFLFFFSLSLPALILPCPHLSSPLLLSRPSPCRAQVDRCRHLYTDRSGLCPYNRYPDPWALTPDPAAWCHPPGFPPHVAVVWHHLSENLFVFVKWQLCSAENGLTLLSSNQGPWGTGTRVFFPPDFPSLCTPQPSVRDVWPLTVQLIPRRKENQGGIWASVH